MAVIGKRALNMFSKHSMVWRTLFIIVAVVVIFWAYKKLTVRQPSQWEMFEDSADHKTCEKTDKPYSLMFFFMETCPHCVDFKPIWHEFIGKAKADMPNLCTCEISAEHEDLLTKYNVRSFPTVLFVNKSGPKVFDGERSVAGLTAFVSQHMSS
jgi:thioredoxin-related protein